MTFRRNNPIFKIAHKLYLTEFDNMPDRLNASPQYRAAEAEAEKAARRLGNDAIVMWEDYASVVEDEASYDNFEKGFLIGVALALTNPAQAMATTAAYYEACPGMPTILPLVAFVPEGGEDDA